MASDLGSLAHEPLEVRIEHTVLFRDDGLAQLIFQAVIGDLSRWSTRVTIQCV
jgi:hypothetical protein